ncbi:MAG: amino acid adenylation domain-containing protein [Candidatus Electrothrix sp. AUS4]|nr:amino acid adenylation domain-containing protein [Candidatus Electrothrix sp. AUS4]
MTIQTTGRHPASLIQEQFWLINKLQPDNPAYNIPSLFCLKGDLNIEALVKSLTEIIFRHDVFRTTFSREKNQLHQVVAQNAELFFQTVELHHFSKKDQNEQARYHIRKEVTTPFDLTNGPLFRTTLFCSGKQEYILLFVIHHIIVDLHSKELFSSELSALYSAFASGNSLPLPTSPTNRYKDFSLWQHNWLKEKQCKVMTDYWQKTLKDHSGYLNLPTDRPRPPAQTISGNAVPFQLSQSFSGTLKEFSRTKNTGLFLTLLTVYYILLYRYTDQKDIIAGVPFTNRRQEHHKDIMGCFVNILPIAVTVSPEQRFEDILQQVRMAMLGAHRNQELPYDLIVRKLQPKRDASFNPFFQTGFTFEPPMELSLDDVEVKSQKIHNQGAQLDLFFTLWEEDEEIHGLIEFNSSLFEEATITRLVGNYQTLLQEIMIHQDRSINSLNILTDHEKYQQLVQWNTTAAAVPEEPLLHTLFERQTEKTPNAPAVLFKNEQLTYQQLNSRANQLAHYLHSQGVRPGAFVGIYMERSLDMLVALFAILKAGGSYVPLDPAFPQDRTAFMLEDTCLKLLLTESKIANQLPAPDINKILIDTDWASINSQPLHNLNTAISPDNLAYIIYTSGSTGKPKGVQVPHKAVVNFLCSMSRTPGLTAKDTLLAVTTLSFDISVLELFLPLAIGGKTVIASRQTASDGEQLRDLLHTSKATVMQATPTTWYLLMAAGWQGARDFKILCGGELLSREMASKLNQRSQNVWNMYGPTETTVWSTCYKISTEDSRIPIGKPIANTQIYIVNRDNQPNPVGVAGEMLIGGAGVTCGYLNRPDLTGEKFIQNIFNKESSRHKLYKTGDLARYLPDGSIEVLGRMDNQIKLRGYRIELGEIEAVLENHPAVKQAATIVREDDPGDKRLTAYIALNNDETFTERELRQYLRSKLPEYMVPSIFIQIKEMPLTLNGKIDRRALPEPAQKRAYLADNFVPPETETEKNISQLWCEILKIDKVGTQDKFFDIGGNSLLSVRLIDLLEKQTGIALPIVKFYQYPTIETLANYIQSKKDPEQHLAKKTQNRAQLQRSALAKRQGQKRN